MTTTVSTKGQVVIPQALRDKYRIRPGDDFLIEDQQTSGEYELKLKPVTRRRRDVLEGLLGCPVKGWFKPEPRDPDRRRMK
jgi:AbrB family looped-hinge helix DNA binding protein